MQIRRRGLTNRLIKKLITQPNSMQHNGSQNKSHCKAKAIGSNPLAGFQVQIGCGAVLAMVLGEWGKPLDAVG
jgi:hypothetical protein